MNAVLKLAVASLMFSNAAFAATTDAKIPDRRVVLASNAARALIVEAKLDGQFYFERCFLPNAATKTVAQELATGDFKDCVEISRPLADTEVVRAEFGQQFGQSLNDLFERHSRYNAVSRTVIAGGLAVIAALVVPLLPFRYVSQWSARRITSVAVASGALAALVVGYHSGEHMDELGLGREVENSLDGDLGGDLILLDQQTKAPRHARQALTVFELALDEATAATVAKHLN